MTYKTPSPTEDEEEMSLEQRPLKLHVDFGEDLQLGSCPTRKVIIRNNTAIAAPFNVNVVNYVTRPPTPPSSKTARSMPDKSQRRAMLNRTANLADPNSKTPAKVGGFFT